MEPLNRLKRRSTDLLKQAQENLHTKVDMPNLSEIQGRLPSLPHFRQKKTRPANDVQATWERIDIPSLPRSSHTLNVVSGCAYVFGGEVEPRQPVDNDMHIIRLPFSSAGADYHKVRAKATALPEQSQQQHSPPALSESPTAHQAQSSLDDVALQETSSGKGKEIAKDEASGMGQVPGPRVGHATAVIGSRIFLFGGRGGPDMQPLQEAGRVWVYDTRSHTWSYLDPAPAVKGGAIVPHPAPRSYHCATATNRPHDTPHPAGFKKPQTWRQWALGDAAKTGIPQKPVVGYVAEEAVDQESDGYGTLLIHAGCLASGDRTGDLWAFDVRARTWTELPAAPGPSRGGSSICISKSRLYRFGGYDGETEAGGQLDFLHLEVETFDDGHTKAEVAIHARGGWQTIRQGDADASSTEIHAELHQEWPPPRSVASLQALTVGGGKEVLVLCMGERAPSADGHEGAGTLCNDVWTFQVPPLGMTAASLAAAVYQAVGRKTGEGKWQKLRTGPHDHESGGEVPTPRGWLASAPMTDVESAVVIWGGLGADNKRIGDGWILRLGE
ncbi:uncharacterized protein UV8b_00132 [Ustilaginoidea virens]|uniref:Uncharacterized protein n=1 Tax=Ustilaginoidea virens TaxID=1159556 RepID=A0A063BTN5_USTVR|nr:uncharacterized protein UV8b_00132 [Ustilaginoidea virens]QUC15891.1 hypothetical protein UV8b_00132 [Ustilaginoidea virens]GAO19458.1 hypothetical protein UVI_02064130 [Ustilaginoidea virens]